MASVRKCRRCRKRLEKEAHLNREFCPPCAKIRFKITNTKSHLAWRKRHPEGMDAVRRRYGQKVKQEALSHYGKDGRVRCCWHGCFVIDIDMLSIDHIADNGKTHRKSGATSGIGFYACLRKEGWPEGYQTLCANHQIKKEILRRRNKARCYSEIVPAER